ncbi:hypothetical protein CCACVL1_03723 [Corchorus capsularis]|uniref:ZF-HD dimerization-type domain-containing protein n=1 Tax=Corchorus capsularis TaxID=210143 RepID=A0A1R3JXP0_COCAP|nr:hypothetical protein CCACVL1_03723 [Corchorus capsularis]
MGLQLYQETRLVVLSPDLGLVSSKAALKCLGKPSPESKLAAFRSQKSTVGSSRLQGWAIECAKDAHWQWCNARCQNAIALVRYRECLKNHAAAIGGNATDGCGAGEFMPNGEEGTLEALKCSACNCHRNFHRKEIQCDCPFPFDCYHNSAPLINSGRKLILGPHQNYILAASPAAAVTAVPPLMKAGSSVPSETDEKLDDNGGGGGGGRVGAKGSGGGGKLVRKSFRTKFSQEQKEKMLKFAEKAEWRIQKLDESVVQQLCQEIGIKRRVLKETGMALIATACKKTENPQDCISLLESDPRSFISNLTGLARIALEITAWKANTSLIVAEYWLQHAKDYPGWASASACRGGYEFSMNSMQDSLRAFDELKFDKSYQSLQYVISNVTYCENMRADGFNDLNATMLKITKYVLAILHQLF